MHVGQLDGQMRQMQQVDRGLDQFAEMNREAARGDTDAAVGLRSLQDELLQSRQVTSVPPIN
jgi:hypothetical protein